MEATMQGMNWLMNRKPELSSFAIIAVCAVSITSVVLRFDNRVTTVEKRVEDISKEMDERFDKVDQRFDKIDQRFEKVDQRFDKVEADIVEIKLFMKKIDTYLSTTSHKDKGE